MNGYLQDLKCGGRPMTKLELANKEIERLHSIIKEVRERLDYEETNVESLQKDILEILDKENKE